MTKSYSEKLKDPRWQKLRLEVLSAADWHCEQCGDGESTLHVHHHQYLKGREPWEYEAGQLSALCESCHESKHDEEDPLVVASSFVKEDGPWGRESTASLIKGFTSQAWTNIGDPDAYVLGQMSVALLRRFPSVLLMLQIVEHLDQCKSRYAVLAALEKFNADLAANQDISEEEKDALIKRIGGMS